MMNKRPRLWTHPFVGKWMGKFDLELSDTCTEVGYVAGPKLDRYPEDFLFRLDDLMDDLERLNLIYGTSFDENFLDARCSGCTTLREISEESSEARRASEIFSELNGTIEGVYIAGLRFPKCDFIYTESTKLDERLKDSYGIHEVRPSLMHCPNFIPVEKKYRPKV